jgi:glycosyltransferase involved in cell wall biosynthesis
MKIGVELYHMIGGETGGMFPLVEGLLEALFAGWPEHEVALFCTPLNEGMLAPAPAQVRRFVLPRDDSYFPLLGAYASRLGLDVLLSTYPCERETGLPLSRQVTLVPDCQHEFFPDFFPGEALEGRRRSFARVLAGGGAIGTLSEHARRTLRDHPACRCDDIFLVSPALRTEWDCPSVEKLTEAERALLPAGDFLLYPANLWPHKNHRRVLQAFERFLRGAGRPVELVLTGHPEGWAELARAYPVLPVRHLGFVRRGFLQVLLARARALVFFSLFEGFGMPLLEAFAAGTPVLCSNTTSLPEVGGDAVLSCDPTDPAAMSELMARAFNDQALRDRLTARGRERLALYSWHASAAQLVAACRRVCERPAGPVEDAVRPLEKLSRHVRDREAECAARLDVIRRLEADCAAGLERGRRLEAVCAARLELAQRLEAECAARMGVIERLDHALRCSRAECTALSAENQRLGAESAARLAEAQRLDAALLQSEAQRQALDAEVRRLNAALQAPAIRSLRACKRLVRGALRPFRSGPTSLEPHLR